MEIERGKIRNPEYSTRVINFSGLRYGKITPTDLDGFIDFGDKVFILIEAKFEGRALLAGQRLALARLCDACWRDGKITYLFICSHSCTSGEINAAAMRVIEIRNEGEWRFPIRPVLLGEAIKQIREKCLTCTAIGVMP